MGADPTIYSDVVSLLSTNGLTLRQSAGSGAAGRIRNLRSTITGTTGDYANPYRMVRVPSNALIAKVAVGLDAAVTTFTDSIGVRFSDNLNDGTRAPGDQTTVGELISTSFFAYELDMSQFGFAPQTLPSDNSTRTVQDNDSPMNNVVIGPTIGLGWGLVDVTFANAAGNSVTDGYYKPSNSKLPLWQAIVANATTGPASTWINRGGDPGGFFDITIEGLSGTPNSGAPVLTLECEYIDG